MKLLSMQGKVTDGQYINETFVTAMNNPIIKIVTEQCKKEDANIIGLAWIDKVFSKYHDSHMVTRVLSRITLFHQLFRNGKMHAVAKATAKELKLPFNVTIAYAPQRFMSSSYLAVKNLQKSYEVYVETFKDHHNAPDMLYKLCGNDFIFDLCGLIDLLWPLVVLMLRAQQEWCPGWKFPAFVDKVRKQITLFQQQISKSIPSKESSPLLHMHAKEIEEMRYGKSTLVLGWILEEKKTRQRSKHSKEHGSNKEMQTLVGVDGTGGFTWVAREPNDCRKDLKELATGILEELDERFKNSFPELNNLLHHCLDFGILLNGVCCKRENKKKISVNQSMFAKLGAKEFSRCVAFVSHLPDVASLNLPLCEENSGEAFWPLKNVLISLVWGEAFSRVLW